MNLQREPGLWKRAVVWLLVLAPFFFASYGFATWYTAQRPEVGSLVFDWESHMPFWAWTIVPYWSIDLLYGFSLLACLTRRQLDIHALRLLSAQVLAVSCFLLWPLRFTFERPAMDGLFGWLFAVLAGFDKPYNQAPSLHIALLVILWVCYARYLQVVHKAWRWLLHGWFALIGLSVLTTWQHHFIDLPTGALAGWLCVWLWPDQGPGMLSTARLSRDPKSIRIAACYGLGTTLCAVPALVWQDAWLWLLWPGVALLLVALNYLLFGARGFQKAVDGKLSPAVAWLLAPYRLGAWINSRASTWHRPAQNRVVDNVWLGRIPDKRDAQRFTAIVDMCAELPVGLDSQAYRSFPQLDLIAPSSEKCLAAAQAIEQLQASGPTLVCCALGYSRSATVVAAWLLSTGRATSVDNVVGLLNAARPGIVLHAAHHRVLDEVLALSTHREGLYS